MCVCVCVGTRLTSDMIRTPYVWLNKLYSCYVATVVIIVNGHGLGIIDNAHLERSVMRLTTCVPFNEMSHSMKMLLAKW